MYPKCLDHCINTTSQRSGVGGTYSKEDSIPFNLVSKVPFRWIKKEFQAGSGGLIYVGF